MSNWDWVGPLPEAIHTLGCSFLAKEIYAISSSSSLAKLFAIAASSLQNLQRSRHDQIDLPARCKEIGLGNEER